jgi:glycine/D-amino acid oxidase-like deaminating enzyme
MEDRGFDTTVTPEGIAALRVGAAQILPHLNAAKTEDVWVGLRPATPDGLPILGKVPETENLYIATGHFRNGILLAPVTAQLMADCILHGTEPPSAFGMHRFAPRPTEVESLCASN